MTGTFRTFASVHYAELEQEQSDKHYCPSLLREGFAMKMAKASNADIEVAMDLCSVLDSLTGWCPSFSCRRGVVVDLEDSEPFDRDDREQCVRVLGHLLDLSTRASLMRVVLGCTVMLDPRNKYVDPDADTIEHHPDAKAGIAAKQARSLDEWHESMGPVLWWQFPTGEPPWVGQPIDDDWPHYHTHWTRLTVPDRQVNQMKTSMPLLQQAIADVQAGKYVDLDIATANDVILLTQSLGADWDVFLKNAPNTVLHTEFCPCINLNDLRAHVLREIEQSAHEEDILTLPERVRNSFDSAAIHCQKYEINVEGTKGKIFIWRTPTEIDFDRARAVILFVLALFKQAVQGDKFIANIPHTEVTMTVRGMERFFDIKIKSEINGESWIGFDFR